ncbi:MAG TPA: retropepsin-like aspartic protease [Gemmatimonadaceae bacterium]|nr:retropepsin-like aspartic protease [Gemmatimonadaceae bacterium]
MLRINHRSITLLLLVAAGARSAGGQTLAPELVERLRRGAASITVPPDSAVVPLVGTRTLPLVDVLINGKGPFRLLVDLGANVTLLRRAVFDSAGGTVLVERASSDIVRVTELRIGSASFREVTLATYDELDVDGVLGYNLLQHTSFTLDFPQQRLVLHNRTLPEPDGVRVHAFVLQGRLPYLVARVGSDSLLLNLDTGAAEEMTVPPTMEDRLRWLTAPILGRVTVNNQTGRTRVREGRLADTLRIGSFKLASPLVFVNPAAEDSWLGAAAINRARWTFDPGQRRVQIDVP